MGPSEGSSGSQPRVLVVGSGSREHAIVQSLLRSPRRPSVLCAGWNAGIAEDVPATVLEPDDVEAVVGMAQREAVDLVVVGPEAPLVKGLADALAGAGIRCFGPGKAAAALEGSKSFCKEVMAAAGVATAAYTVVSSPEEGLAAVASYPTVIKADGLAAGKGVVIAPDESVAGETLNDLLVRGRFGTTRVVVEEFLEGTECSLLALCDGESAVPLASAQDYKRIYDGDHGPNTGGMGAYSPVPAVDEERAREICAAVHQPVLDEMASRGFPFHGCLYAGLMLTSEGPKVLEFNVRFGDPETQAVLPRLRSDLLGLLEACTVRGGLRDAQLEWAPEAAVTVVLASPGYPGEVRAGSVIHGLDSVPGGVYVAHAGTSRSGAGEVVTSGGRVLSVTALGADAAEARATAYAAADMIEFDGRQMRRDIALGV